MAYATGTTVRRATGTRNILAAGKKKMVKKTAKKKTPTKKRK